ncbi:peptidoglycan binding domain protein [Colletotrichum graminicola]|nr:peptidoglycan binding domain protein [Colletotrichum graminicola]
MEALRKKSATVAMSAYRSRTVSDYRDGIKEISAKYRTPQSEDTEVDNTEAMSIGSSTLYSESGTFDIPEDKEEIKQFLGEMDEEIVEPDRVDIRVYVQG